MQISKFKDTGGTPALRKRKKDVEEILTRNTIVSSQNLLCFFGGNTVMVHVKLEDIVEAIDSSSEETSAFIHKPTGTVYFITNEEIGIAEDDEDEEDCPEWQKENIQIARDYLKRPEDYLALPTKFDLDEYRLMEQFCLAIEDNAVREKMLYAIKGSGAFRRFKEELRHFNLADEWYKQRDLAIRDFARDWCLEHDLSLVKPAQLDKDCIFCKILARELPSSIVYQDEYCTAFLDAQPVNPGHVLIVPNSHAVLLEDIEEQLAGHLFKTAQKVGQALRTCGIQCEGVNIFLADGQAAMQEVPHVHLHVFPRFSGDGFGLQFGPGYTNKPERSELDQIAEQIRLAL